MHCNKCGNKLNETSLFCDHCGAKVISNEPAPASARKDSSALPSENRKPERKKSAASTTETLQSHTINQLELISGLATAVTAILVSISLISIGDTFAFITLASVAMAVFSGAVLILKHTKKNQNESLKSKYTILSLALPPISALFYYLFFFFGAGAQISGGFLFFFIFISGSFNVAAYIFMNKSLQDNNNNFLGVCLSLCSFILNLTAFFPTIRILINLGNFEAISLFLFVFCQIIFSVCAVLSLIIGFMKSVIYTPQNPSVFIKSQSIAGYSILTAVLISVIIITSCNTFIGTNIISRDVKSYNMTGYGADYPRNSLIYVSPKDLFRLEELETLNLDYSVLTNELIEIVGECKQLKSLSFTSNRPYYIDYSPLRNLTDLEYLNMWGTGVTDASFVSGMENLKYLNMELCGLTDISGITNCTKLEELYLSKNEYLDNIIGMYTLTSLKYLDLSECGISDIYDLEKLTAIEYLDLSFNNIEDTYALRNMNQLTELKIIGNYSSMDVSHLSNLESLRTLHLNGSTVINAIAIAEIPNLEVLYISKDNLWSDTLDELQNLMPYCEIKLTY